MNMNPMNLSEPDALFQQAVSLHRSGKLTEASAVYRKLLKLSPMHPSGLAYLGMIEFQKRNLEESVRLAIARRTSGEYAFAFPSSTEMTATAPSRSNETVMRTAT